MRSPAVLILSASLLLAACTPAAHNPSFPLTHADAAADLDRIAADPRPLERPVVIVAGWADPFLMGMYWNRTLRRTVGLRPGRDFIVVQFVGSWTFDACRAKLIDAVQDRWPSDNVGRTVEVDVIAHSMGGLVARYAALPPMAGNVPPAEGDRAMTRQLDIRTLFTLATPHRGARLAAWPSLDPRIRAMKAESPFMDYLDDALPDAYYDLVPYVRLGDFTVGDANAQPSGRGVWWVPNRPLRLSLFWARHDRRLTADILRRLRGETPFTTTPPAPLPE